MRRNVFGSAAVGVLAAALFSAGVLWAQNRSPIGRDARRPAAAVPRAQPAAAGPISKQLVAKTALATVQRVPASIGRDRTAFEQPSVMTTPVQAAPGGRVVSSHQYGRGRVVQVFTTRQRVELAWGATLDGNVIVKDDDGTFTKVRWGGTACPGYTVSEHDADRFTQLLVAGKKANILYDEYDHDSDPSTESSLCLVGYFLQNF